MKDEYGLTPKQRKFADIYLEEGNGAEAARQAYNIGGKGGKTHTQALLEDGRDTTSSNAIAKENLRKPTIQRYLSMAAEDALRQIHHIAQYGEEERNRLRASIDLADRGGWKAKEESEQRVIVVVPSTLHERYTPQITDTPTLPQAGELP